MNKIAELRKKNNLNQLQLAKLLNTTQANISGWENEKWQPDNDALIKMADIFNVSVDYLIGRSDIKNPENPNLHEVNKNVITIYGRGSGTKTAQLTDKQYQAVLAIVESFADNPDAPFKK